MKLSRIILQIMLFGVLLFQAYMGWNGSTSSAGLKGYFTPPETIKFSLSGWFSGRYQSWVSQNADEPRGFRSSLVRLNNQLDFTLFRIPHAENIIAGKNNCLFSKEYIESYLGLNFAGKRFIEKKVKRIKLLQDQLWTKYKIFLLVIFTPDKGTYFPENIPSRFLDRKKEINNYQYYSCKLVEAGVHFIDFNRYWTEMKDTSRYPLYPLTGIHWSYYGALVAADSLANYLRKHTGFDLPSIIMDRIDLSSRARYQDNDISQAMNLIWDIPHPPYAYPDFHLQPDHEREKPKCLFVGDSFYWNWYDPGIIRHFFSNEEFWYYNKELYPESKAQFTSTTQVDLLQAIRRQNIIILLQTNAAAGDPGFGFVEYALSVIDPEVSRLPHFINTIKNDPNLLREVQEKAKNQNISLDDMILQDALFLVNDEMKKNRY